MDFERPARVLLSAREKKSGNKLLPRTSTINSWIWERRVTSRGSKNFSCRKCNQYLFLLVFVLQISVTQVRDILKNYAQGLPILDSEKGGAKIQPKNDPYSYFLKEEISRKIYSYHEKNEYFTIDDLFCYATQDLEYTQSATTVWRIVKSMEYRYKK
jgi:hypothetical protein